MEKEQTSLNFTQPEENAKDDYLKLLEKSIFEDENLKRIANVIKVELPAGLLSYLDFVEESDDPNEPMKTIGLKLFTKTVVQKSYLVSMCTTREQLQDLNRFNIDSSEILNSVLVNEAKTMLFNAIFEQIEDYAEKSYRKTWTKGEIRKEKFTKWIHINMHFLEKWLPKIFKGIYKKQYVITKEMSTSNAIRMITTKILGACNKLAAITRRGSGNAIITNIQMASILQDSPAFVHTDSECTISHIKHTPGIYKIGTLNGIDVLVNPYLKWNDNQVTVFRVPKDSEPGIYLTYMGVDSMSTIAEGTMAPKIAIKLRCNPIFVGNQDSADKYYDKMYFKFEKMII